jgi:hypothetical protein
MLNKKIFSTAIIAPLIFLSVHFKLKGQTLPAQDQWVFDPGKRLSSEAHSTINKTLSTFNSSGVTIGSDKSKIGVSLVVCGSLEYTTLSVMAVEEKKKINRIEEMLVYDVNKLGDKLKCQELISKAFKNLAEAGYQQQIVYLVNQIERFDAGKSYFDEVHTLYVKGWQVESKANAILPQIKKPKFSDTAITFDSRVGSNLDKILQTLKKFFFTYYIYAGSSSTKYYYGDTPFLAEQIGSINLVLNGHEPGQLAGITWRIIDVLGKVKKICKGKASCPIDISNTSYMEIEIAADNNLIYKTEAVVIPAKRISVFNLPAPQSGEFGFDDASSYRLSGYEYYPPFEGDGPALAAPWVSLLPNQQVQLDLAWYSKNQPGKDSKITIRSRSPDVLDMSIGDIRSDEFVLTYEKLKNESNTMTIRAKNSGKASIIAKNEKGEIVGQLTVECKPVVTKNIVFIHVNHGTGFREKNFVSEGLEFLNKKAFNQIFMEWKESGSFFLDIRADFNPKPDEIIYAEDILEKVLDLFNKKYKLNLSLSAPYDPGGAYYVFLTDIPNVQSKAHGISAGGIAWTVPSNYCILFNRADYLSLVHELGHCVGLEHSFEGTSHLPKGTTKNFMDYTTGANSFFLYQSRIAK